MPLWAGVACASGRRDKRFRDEDWHAAYCKSDWAADTPVKTFHVLFATILWGDGNDTRLVLISLRSIMGEETVPKQGHLIYSEPHMTFSTNWCEILCKATTTSSHSLSLILALFLLLLLLNLSPLSFLSSSVLPLVLAQTLAFIVSSQIKKGQKKCIWYISA